MGWLDGDFAMLGALVGNSPRDVLYAVLEVPLNLCSSQFILPNVWKSVIGLKEKLAITAKPRANEYGLHCLNRNKN